MPPVHPIWDILIWCVEKAPGLAVVIGAVWALIKWLGKPLKGIKDDVEMVKKELQTNGGGSLKDAVKNVERTVSGVKTDVEALTRSQAGQTKKLSLLTRTTAQLKKGQEQTRTMITPLLDAAKLDSLTKAAKKK